ncbi:uncharacterized protein LOC129268409 [Lytechinus pictus]|uniref:uncharacterized protein LOC129268409 n=1 Tax=Lytechinus pictus TaxID=7653 RepID=UPI0030BA0632
MSGRTVSRASLGRSAHLGALYDVRTEKFLKDNLFVSRLEDDKVESMDIDETVIEVTKSDELQEKFKTLDVEPELQMSVLTDMVKLSGSGAYLGDDRKSAMTQSMSLIYKVKTVNEEVMLSHNRGIIDKDILSDASLNATHVVVGIDWGVQCLVTCEYENTSQYDVAIIREEMKAMLEKLRDILIKKEEVGVSIGAMRGNEKREFPFQCRTDISAPDNDIPVTYEGVVELMGSLPALLKSTNNCKGVPVTYYLMPLETIRKKCKVKIAKETTYKEVDEGMLRMSKEVMEKLREITRKIYDIHNNMSPNADFISDEALDKIDEVWHEVTMQESRFKSVLKVEVKSVRSGKGDSSIMEEFLGKMKHDELSASKYEVEFEPFLKKVRFIRSMFRKGIKYIGKRERLAKNAKENIFVFYIPNGSDGEVLEKNQDFFMRLVSTFSGDDTCEFIVVDQEIVSNRIWPNKMTKPTVEKYENGVHASKDLYEDEGQYLEVSMIQVAHPETTTTTPRDRTFVKIRCPNALTGKGSCAGDPSKWRCSKCKQFVEYSTSTKLFHCKCGKSNPEHSKFRCNDPNHGMYFMKYPSTLLNDDLSQLKPMKEVNILILGETGVGKSTWINGIQNYLTFPNLAEAMNSQDFPVLIPSSFTLTQDGEQREIKVGVEDANEVQEVGKSATKEPRSYVFTVGDRRVRLIDTPGIGDCGGIKQDERNMHNILSHLTFYTEINAICILLKPNNSRLTAMFRFCIQELLVQLHNSAKNNIVFCFTNARQTFYQPGDTLPALNKELEKRNVGIKATKDKYFCFDNEPFRFLACIKNGVTFNDGDIATYSASWDKSVEETARLLKYIESGVKPHRVKETLGMNEARRIIVAMSKPLAEVAKTINHNLDAARETKTKIGLADTEIDSLKEDLKFNGYDVEQKELGHPMTVCTAPECIKYVPIGQTKVQNTVYQTICHDHCYLEGVPVETTGNEQLQECLAMTNGECRSCSHSYMQHMHMTYQLEVIEKEFLSQEIQDQINKICDTRTQKEAFIAEINKKVGELKEEQKIIMGTGAKFGSFLKAHALITYNDAVGDYLDMSIKQEEVKPDEIRDEGLLETLRQMKDEYHQQREILDNAMDKGSSENIKTPEQVRELQEKLFKLPHFGATLKKLFEEISIEHTAKNIPFKEKIVHAPPPRMASKLRKGGKNLAKGFVDSVSKFLPPWRP